MSEFPSAPDPRAARPSSLLSRARPAHLAIAAALAGVFGLAGLRVVDLPGPRPVDADERLKIEVVAAPEPPVAPGSVMEVGELVDGFQGIPPAPAVEEVAWVPYEEEWDDWRAERAPPPDRRRFEEPVIQAPTRPEPPRAQPPRDRWFGFDLPRRDYRAEREARRARLEARMEYERERDKPRRYESRPDRDPVPDRRFDENPPPPGFWD